MQTALSILRYVTGVDRSEVDIRWSRCWTPHHTKATTSGSSTKPFLFRTPFDLPPVAASVVEHRLFSGTCAGCGQRRAAQTPSAVPSGRMGPRLIAWIAMLSRRFHLSIRIIPDTPGRAVEAALQPRGNQRGTGPRDRGAGASLPAGPTATCARRPSSTPTRRTTSGAEACFRPCRHRLGRLLRLRRGVHAQDPLGGSCSAVNTYETVAPTRG